MGIQTAAQRLRVEAIARQDSLGHWSNRRNRRNGCDRHREAAIRKCRIHDAIAESRWEEKDERDGRRDSRVRGAGSYNVAIRIGVRERRESWLAALSSSFMAFALGTKQAQLVACLTEREWVNAAANATCCGIEWKMARARAAPHGPRQPKPGPDCSTFQAVGSQMALVISAGSSACSAEFQQQSSSL